MSVQARMMVAMSEQTFTPRLVAIEALARREAELHGRSEALEVDAVKAILWEGGSFASRALSSVVDDGRLQQTLAGGDDSVPTVNDLLGAAVQEAEQRGHSYLGVEHVV